MVDMKAMIDRAQKLWVRNYKAGKGANDPLVNHFELGEPLLKSEIQMTNCIDFVGKKAIIFLQESYSLTNLVHKEFGRVMCARKNSATATQIAYGLGIEDKDITYFEDMKPQEMDAKISKIKREL